MLHSLNNKGNFFIHIALPSLLAIILFISTIFFIVIPYFEKTMMDGKRETIRELNDSAYSLIAKFHNDEKKGVLNRAQAQRKAISAIKNLRYGDEGKDYFWITDLHPNMIMHPYRPDMDGQDLSDFKDPKGTKLFVQFVKTVKASNGKPKSGFVKYMWQWKDNPNKIVPKLSYVLLFQPWNWIIGTGIYTEDVGAEINKLKNHLTKLSLAILAIIILLLFYINRQSHKVELSRQKAEKKVRVSEEKHRKLIEASTEGIMMVLGARTAYANKVLLNMTGFNEGEFLSLGLSDIISDEENEDFKVFDKTLKKGAVPKPIETRLKRKDKTALNVLLTASKIIFMGKNGFVIIIKDISQHKRIQSELTQSREKILVELQTSLLSLTQSLKTTAQKIIFCEKSLSAHKAAEIMTNHKNSAILIKDGKDFVGIVTDHDLRKNVLSIGKKSTVPVSEIMSSPLISLSQEALSFEAVLLMQDKDISHLPMKDNDGKITGIIDSKQMLKLKWYSPDILLREFYNERSVSTIIANQKRLPGLIKTLSDSGAAPPNINRVITATSNAIMESFIKLAISELGEPPAKFAFMILGSQARGEQTLATDQDNALVFEDVDKTKEKEVQDYFLKLSEKVSGWLDEAGYPFCAGGIMAKNPVWCQPFAKWKDYFNKWSGFTKPQDLIDVNIFFDFRCLYGDIAITKDLRKAILEIINGKSIFFINMAQNAILHGPAISILGNIEVATSGENLDTFDIKRAIKLITNFTRLYALRNNIEALSTIERLENLLEKNVIDKDEHETITQSYNFLMRLRLKHQTAQASENIEPDNFVNPHNLSKVEKLLLKNATAGIVEISNKLKYLVKFLLA
ncbi:MAG: DUF294 nucleotidyltransferase-like domain-containing protein [Elusimicrobiota bacterium]|nr:DUF294 nucleotidyltransferase-like domain-containing protein [Elusimicrobiota bacterium]